MRNVAARGYCAAHLAQLYARIDPAAFQDGGLGMQAGPLRPDWGPLFADLRCSRCDATWTGVPGARCWWCQRGFEIQREHQAGLLQTPPDIDPDDGTYERRMEAWADRMVVGVRAGLITVAQAEGVWNGVVKRSRAT